MRFTLLLLSVLFLILPQKLAAGTGNILPDPPAFLDETPKRQVQVAATVTLTLEDLKRSLHPPKLGIESKRWIKKELETLKKDEAKTRQLELKEMTLVIESLKKDCNFLTYATGILIGFTTLVIALFACAAFGVRNTFTEKAKVEHDKFVLELNKRRSQLDRIEANVDHKPQLGQNKTKPESDLNLEKSMKEITDLPEHLQRAAQAVIARDKNDFKPAYKGFLEAAQLSPQPTYFAQAAASAGMYADTFFMSDQEKAKKWYLIALDLYNKTRSTASFDPSDYLSMSYIAGRIAELSQEDEQLARGFTALKLSELARQYNPLSIDAYKSLIHAYTILSHHNIGKREEYLAIVLEIAAEADHIVKDGCAYNLACMYALAGKDNEARDQLTRAIRQEKDLTRKEILSDIDFKDVHNKDWFISILEDFYPEGSAA